MPPNSLAPAGLPAAQSPLSVPTMDMRSLSERDICTKFITPALHRAGWDELSQIREEAVSYTHLTLPTNREV